MLRLITLTTERLHARVQKNNKLVEVYWSQEPLRNLVCAMRPDCVLSKDQARVLEAGMKKMDAVIAQVPTSTYRVLHATPSQLGGPLRSGIVVIAPETLYRELDS
jgi:hypothetical protein